MVALIRITQIRASLSSRTLLIEMDKLEVLQILAYMRVSQKIGKSNGWYLLGLEMPILDMIRP